LQAATVMSSEAVKVLFLGRHDCGFSSKLVELLRDSGAETTIHLSNEREESLPSEIHNWTGAYIFGFRSLIIVPPKILNSARIGAINFHPGPPEYPGSGCTNFALYEGADMFGVTAHLMEEIVDSGKILSVSRFPIQPEDNLETLTEKTREALFALASQVISEAIKDDLWVERTIQRFNPSISWSGKRRKISAVHRLASVSVSIDEEEMLRRVRAFHYTGFPLNLNLHDFKFVLASTERHSNH
jgi:methionyl-tRNA formyltransferase